MVLSKSRQGVLALFFAVTALVGCGESNEVKSVCTGYMKARIAMDRGDSTQLEQYVTDSIYLFMRLNETYMREGDAPVISANLRIPVASVEVEGDCGSCTMGADSHYVIDVCKVDDGWKVVSENGTSPTPQSIAELREKIAAQRELKRTKPQRDSVFKVMNRFYGGVKNLYKKGELTDLFESCDDETLDFIRRIHVYSLERTGEEVLLKELDRWKSGVTELSYEGDRVIAPLWRDPGYLMLNRSNDGYLVTGLNGMVSSEIGEEDMVNGYLGYMKALKVVTSKAVEDGVVN